MHAVKLIKMQTNAENVTWDCTGVFVQNLDRFEYQVASETCEQNSFLRIRLFASNPVRPYWKLQMHQQEFLALFVLQ